MIITKTPFRVSFCGGGSDLPSFYENYGGCVLSTSINKYCYISIHPYFNENQTLLKYSENELVDDIKDIKHKIFKQVLTDLNVSGVEIVSSADIPGGTGLGSSSTFTVGLLNTLYSYKGKYVSKNKLAKLACEIEIEKLGSPIGKQDQYGAALGGLNFIAFNKDGSVSSQPVLMNGKTYSNLQKNLIMFYTGKTRSANDILKEQSKNATEADKIKNLLRMCDLAKNMKSSLEENDISSFGKILDEGWRLKKELASGIANSMIDECYELAIKSGALGGKLLGAGGAGFMLFYCEEDKQDKLRENIKLKEIDFKFENDGTSVIYIGDKYWD